MSNRTTFAHEGAQARHWREEIVHLSREELASRTGYSVRMIVNYEQGSHPVPITFRLACAAVAAGIEFDWTRPRAKVVEERHVFLG